MQVHVENTNADVSAQASLSVEDLVGDTPPPAAGVAREPVADIRRMELYGKKLYRNGYAPVPIKPGTKAPETVRYWTRVSESLDPVKVRQWVEGYGDWGVGIATYNTPAVDIDVRDADVSAELNDLAEAMLGWAPVRVGQAPKCLRPYRCEDRFTKATSPWYRPPGGAPADTHRIEILAAGEQFVASAIHPDTHRPFQWFGGTPLEIKRDDLTLITAEGVGAYLAAAAEVFKRHGWDEVERAGGRKNARKSDGSFYVTPAGYPLEVLKAAVAKCPNESEDWDTWTDWVLGLRHETRGGIISEAEAFSLFSELSAKHFKYDFDKTNDRWRSAASANGSVNAAVIVNAAVRAGWVLPLWEFEDLEAEGWDWSACGTHPKTLPALQAPQAEGEVLPALAIDPTIPDRVRKVYTGQKGARWTIHQWAANLQESPKHGAYASLENVALGLERLDAWRGLFHFDEMKVSIMVNRPIPDWSGLTLNPDEEFPRRIRDADVLKAARWFQVAGLPNVKATTVGPAIAMTADEVRVHPLRSFLKGLVWDRKARVETWLSRYVGAVDSEYTRAVGRMFMVGMIARVMRPGCKQDYCLVLEGEQGKKKSTVAAVLAGEYFSDNLPDNLGNKDASAHVNGRWIIEVSELSAMNKSDVESVKSFITRTHDRYRPPYGRCEVEQPRQCVFIGTTNKRTYLRDETGARRFWPVRVGALDINALEADREQLLAEAVALFQAGAEWWPDAEFERRVILPEQDARYEADPWESEVAGFLAGFLSARPNVAKGYEEATPDDRTPVMEREARGWVTITDVAHGALGLSAARVSTAESRRLSAILEREGWERYPGKVQGGQRVWFHPG